MNWTIRFLSAVVGTLLLAQEAGAVAFFPSNLGCGGPDGHCYQQVFWNRSSGDFLYTYAAAKEFAESQVYNGWPGHLITIESLAEWNSGAFVKEGFLGATGGVNGPYAWDVGPAAGGPVQYFAPFYASPQAGQGAGCAPFVRLCFGNGGYAGVGPTEVMGGFGPGCQCGYNDLVIEYEPDTNFPTASLGSPNGGEALPVGGGTMLSWSASDFWSGVHHVRIQLSRSGPSGPFEDVALDAPNTGTFLWNVTGPPTSAAYLRIVAVDRAGNEAADVSDAAFSIVAPTGVRFSSWGSLKLRYR